MAIGMTRYSFLLAGALVLGAQAGEPTWAQEKGSGPSIGELVSSGRLAELQEQFDDGVPPEASLLPATRFDSEETLALAFENGADPRGLQASRAFLRAKRKGMDRLVQVLAEAGADLEGRDPLGRTLLILAVQEGDFSEVRNLISDGADVDARSNVGTSVLVEALASGRLRIVKALLDAGAAVDGVDRDGWTALEWAVRHETVEVVRLLLKRGAEVNHVDHLGWTPLLLASASGNPEVVHALLAARANPNLSTPTVWSPLIRAVLGGNEDVVRLLLLFGADRRTSFGGHAPLEWAEALNRPELVALLERKRDGR